MQFSNKSNSSVKTPGIKWLETCSVWHWWHDSPAAVSCLLQSFAFTISLKCICRSYSLFLSMSVSLSLQADVFFWGLCKSACSWSLSSQTPLPLASSSPAVNRPPVSFFRHPACFLRSFLVSVLWRVGCNSLTSTASQMPDLATYTCDAAAAPPPWLEIWRDHK